MRQVALLHVGAEDFAKNNNTFRGSLKTDEPVAGFEWRLLFEVAKKNTQQWVNDILGACAQGWEVTVEFL